MSRFRPSLEGTLQRARGVEGFVRLLVGGGLALLAGLWIAELSIPGSPARVAGWLLALAGAGALGGGIWSQIER